jgi:hypothetical protein
MTLIYPLILMNIVFSIYKPSRLTNGEAHRNYFLIRFMWLLTINVMFLKYNWGNFYFSSSIVTSLLITLFIASFLTIK